MAPRDGFEPPTNGLTVRRSTTELPGNSEEARIVGKGAVQVKDVEPALLVTGDGVRYVGCLELRNLGVGQVQREGGERVVKVLGLGSAHDRGSNDGLLSEPCKRHLRAGYAALGREGGDSFDDLAIRFRGIRK